MTLLAGSEPDVRAAIAERRRLAALRDPAMMGRYTLPHTFKVRKHTRYVSQALTELGTPGHEKLIISQPPQTGKSTLASELFPFWWLAKNPRRKAFVASYAASLAIRKGRAVRGLVRSHGARFGLHLEPGDQAQHDWSLTAGGGMRSVGVGGGLTGFPGVLGIIDDPLKDRAQADSKLQRDKVWEWWSGTVVSRMHPEAIYLLVMTRWHHDDIVARLLDLEGRVEEGGQWRVINLEAIAQSGPETDPLGREGGDPLTHPEIDDDDREALLKHWSNKQRGSSALDWGALYLGNPRPVEGAMVSGDLLVQQHDFRHEAQPTISAVAVDPSGALSGNRDTAGIVGGYLDVSGRLYWTHDRSGHMTAEQWSRAACELAVEIDADRILCEINYGGGAMLLAIRTAWNSLRREWDEEQGQRPEHEREPNPYDRLPPSVEETRAKKNKRLRAEPIAQQIKEDRIRFGAYLPDVEREWRTWLPTDKMSPGRIDASVYLAYALLPVPGAAANVAVAGITNNVGHRIGRTGSGTLRAPDGTRVRRLGI